MATTKQRSNLKSSLSFLIYFTLFFGIIPFSGTAYFKHKIIKISLFGNIWVSVSIVHILIQHHFASMKFILNDKQETASLTNIIGLVIVYMEPVMYAIDVIGLLVNQKKLISCLDRMHKIDEKLLKENVKIDYSQVKRLSIILVCAITLVEFTFVTYGIWAYQEFTADSLYWFFAEIPIFLSTISKVWYIVLVYNAKRTFLAINDHLGSTRKIFDLNKKERNSNDRRNLIGEEITFPGYLQKEILVRPTKRNQKVQKVDTSTISGQIEKDIHVSSLNSGNSVCKDEVISASNHLQVYNKLDKKLTNLCQLHDEICGIGGTINSMFSFQMLILMANGFMDITAQCFFLYCGRMGQNIPVLFRSAESILYSAIFIFYMAAKCVCVIFVSWKTKTEAQKTGVQIHKVANAIDEDHCYKVINHLSLKLLNHSLNFTACGFFDLDMTTLYAIVGAITSYLIILIQFNLASNRNKPDGLFNGTISNSSNA